MVDIRTTTGSAPTPIRSIWLTIAAMLTRMAAAGLHLRAADRRAEDVHGGRGIFRDRVHVASQPLEDAQHDVRDAAPGPNRRRDATPPPPRRAVSWPPCSRPSIVRLRSARRAMADSSRSISQAPAVSILPTSERSTCQALDRLVFFDLANGRIDMRDACASSNSPSVPRDGRRRARRARLAARGPLRRACLACILAAVDQHAELLARRAGRVDLRPSPADACGEQ